MGGGGPRLEQPRLSRAHLEPGRPSGDPVQAERGPSGLSRLDLRQSPPRREPLGAAERVAGDRGPPLQNNLKPHWRPLPPPPPPLAPTPTSPPARPPLIPMRAAAG